VNKVQLLGIVYEIK